MKLLPGAQTKIAQQLGVSRQFVSLVLAGKKSSSAVLGLAAVHAQECKVADLRASLALLPKKKLLDILMKLI